LAKGVNGHGEFFERILGLSCSNIDLCETIIPA
jgi:hypothetical protein